jgi:hypothetical protein
MIPGPGLQYSLYLDFLHVLFFGLLTTEIIYIYLSKSIYKEKQIDLLNFFFLEVFVMISSSRKYPINKNTKKAKTKVPENTVSRFLKVDFSWEKQAEASIEARSPCGREESVD